MGAPPAKRSLPVYRRLLVALAFATAGIAGYIFIFDPFSSSGQSQIESVATSYAQQKIVFLKGPTVVSTDVLPLRRLAATLARRVPRHTAQDVNVADLERRFGPDRKLALVVLTGTYNSLPPDEGIVSNGTIVVLVDVRKNRAIFIND
jgi:hypothetical protein